MQVPGYSEAKSSEYIETALYLLNISQSIIGLSFF